jgi:hypothetical protein
MRASRNPFIAGWRPVAFAVAAAACLAGCRAEQPLDPGGGGGARWDNDVPNPAFASLTADDFEVVPLGWKA